MLVLGHRYGSIEPKSKKSYTHVEYEYALEKNKPFFAVVATDEWRIARQKVEEDPNVVVETENPAGLRKFRDIVKSKVCRLFNEKTEIKVAVHESLREVEHEHDLVGWVRGDAIDREAEMAKEIAALKRAVTDAEKRVEKAEKAATKSPNRDWQAISTKLTATNIDATRAYTAEQRDKMEPATRLGMARANVMSCLRWWRSDLLLGVTAGGNNIHVFLVRYVVPELLVYDLTEEVKPTGRGLLSRYILSAKGKEFLHFIESENAKSASK